MPRVPTKVRLQKTLKEGLRRCVYRRWEAEVKGNLLITKTTNLERMYRGNTPYPLRQPLQRCQNYPTRKVALLALVHATSRRRRLGYAG